MIDFSKLDLTKCRAFSDEGRKRLVKTIFINDSLSFHDKNEIKKNVDIAESGFNIEKFYHIGKNDERIYFNLLRQKFENIFEKKEIIQENKFLQSKTDFSTIEKLNRKFMKLGNRDFIKEGHTILIRTLTGQDKYKLDDNINFLDGLLKSISFISNNYYVIGIPTTFVGNLKDFCIEQYENARSSSRNLIIIYGQKLDTGVNLPEINPDITINLSKLGSSDVAVQVLGRIQRPSLKNDKRFCFFFDYNISNILSAIYSTKSLNEPKTEYEFLFDYKDSIFNLSNTELIESDDNYIKELSFEVNEYLNKENDNFGFYEKVTNGSEFADIYQNINKSFSHSLSKDSDLSGSSVSVNKKEIKKDVSDEIDEDVRSMIRQKLKFSYILQEIIKIYRDMSENNCRTVEDIMNLIFSNEDYMIQFRHNLRKMVNFLKIRSSEEIYDIINYIIESIDYKLFNNNLLYFHVIQPINRDKDNINIFFK
jgi:hypothetical protein